MGIAQFQARTAVQGDVYFTPPTTIADTRSPSSGDLGALMSGFNGAAWDRWRSNVNYVALASAARTVATTSGTQINYNAKGVFVFLSVSVASGTGGLALRIRGCDPVTGTMINLNAVPAGVIATGYYTYLLYPGVSSGATQVTSSILPRLWDISITPGDASSYTYSVGYSLIN